MITVLKLILMIQIFLDKSGVIEDLDNSRTLSNLKIKYTEKSNDELRE